MKVPERAEASALADRVRRLLEEAPEVELAILFGSTARGRSRAHSDIDVGLLLGHDGPVERNRLGAAISRATGREVDVVDLKHAPPLLRFQIARDGVLLIERRPHSWADFRARAMLDWWDWQPWAERLNAAAVRRLRAKVAGGQA